MHLRRLARGLLVTRETGSQCRRAYQNAGQRLNKQSCPAQCHQPRQTYAFQTCLALYWRLQGWQCTPPTTLHSRRLSNSFVHQLREENAELRRKLEMAEADRDMLQRTLRRLREGMRWGLLASFLATGLQGCCHMRSHELMRWQ